MSTSIQAVGGTSPSSVALGDVASAPPAALVAEPSAASADPTAALLALQIFERAGSTQRARSDISSLSKQRTVAWKKYKKALHDIEEARRKAEKEEHGFWGTLGKCCTKIGKVGAVAAAVVAVGATGGAAAPLALAVTGAVLSAGAFAQGETHVLQKLGMSDAVAVKFEIGMSVGGALATGGAGALSSGSTTVTSVARFTDSASSVVRGTGAIANGVQAASNAVNKAHLENARADAHERRLDLSHNQYLFDQLVTLLTDIEEQGQRDVDRARGIIDSRAATSLVAAGGRA